MDRIKEPQSVTIRQPATANLMVDSADRTLGNWGNFQITRSQALLNGFFHRIGTTEVVLEWNQPNVLEANAGSVVTVTVGGTDYSVTVPEGFYTVSSLFESLVALLTAEAIPGATWSFSQIDGLYYLEAGTNFDVKNTPLAVRADIYDPGLDGTPARPVTKPDLRPYRYIDFVSSQLTYNQELKDSSTAPIVRDVLCRWYFAWDQPPVLDADGFPVLMGYNPFVLRRLFSPAKQIRWDSIQPIGNVAFQVYDDNQNLLDNAQENNWLMTLQASEN